MDPDLPSLSRYILKILFALVAGVAIAPGWAVEPGMSTIADGATSSRLVIIDDGAPGDELELNSSPAPSADASATSVSVGDYDLDGYPDLYVAEWRPAFMGAGGQSHSRLLHNRGVDAPGQYEDVTSLLGIDVDSVNQDGTWTFSPAFADLDGDTWPDLAIAADFEGSRLFWNDGEGGFEDGTEPAGVGLDEAGMGATIGDYDADGDLDWFVSDIGQPDEGCQGGGCGGFPDGNRLYRNNGDRTFDEVAEAQLGNLDDGSWGWGTAFFDMDNDGDLDITLTNGIAAPSGIHDPRFAGDQHKLWLNAGAGFTKQIATPAGMDSREEGKGLLTFDYDKDGDLDVLVVNTAAPPTLYRNDSPVMGDYVRVRVRDYEGGPTSLHAVVRVQPEPEAPEQMREIGVGSHFLGQSERVAHFGVGTGGEPVARLEVTWPSLGISRTIEDVPRNSRVVITPDSESVHTEG